MSAAAALSRRSLLGGFASLAALRLAPVRALELTAKDYVYNRDLVGRIVESRDGSYASYPHANAFLPDGRCVLADVARQGPKAALRLFAFDFNTGARTPIADLPRARTYWAVARTGRIFASDGAGCLVIEPRTNEVRRIPVEPGWTIAGDVDISPDGRLGLIARSHYQAPLDFKTDLVDLETGRIDTILHPGWAMDHAHFSPFDPAWVCFADNSPNNRDRLWVWHREKAPQGRHLFDQGKAGGPQFDLGHERAMFDKPALIVVAYGNSKPGPAGLYEVGFDGSVRLVSESQRDFHCNISRDGRFAVVSLQGVMEKGRGSGTWSKSEGAYGWSDVVLVNMKTGTRAFLFRAANAAEGQPFEVQPSVSPDGRWVLMKDARARDVIAVELDRAGMTRFLA